MRRILAVAILATSFSGPAAAQMIILTPDAIGQIFCLSRIGNDMAPVEGLLTSGLSAAIAEAESKNAVIQKQHPDEKPPLGDGIPWQAVQDYAPQCSVGAVTLMMDEARVTLNYAFPAALDANFADSLLLKLVLGAWPEQQVWRIDNVAYGTAGDLRKTLVNAFIAN